MRLFLLFSFTTCAVFAQASFEVATVRPTNLSEPGVSTRIPLAPTQQFRMEGYTLKGLVLFAYELEDFQLSGGPGWFDKDRFDIDGKVADGANTGITANRDRLRALLAERFQLSAHKETKQATILTLTVNKGGPKLEAAGNDGGVSWGPGVIRDKNGQINSLARILSQQLSQLVVDRTGLEGHYDYELKWSPDPARSDGPSVFTALQEQLGLKLESEKGPLEVLVVDRAEKPTDN